MKRTYEEAIKEMAKDLQRMWKVEDGSTYNYLSNILSGSARMVAFIFGKEEAEVINSIMAEACK